MDSTGQQGATDFIRTRVEHDMAQQVSPCQICCQLAAFSWGKAIFTAIIQRKEQKIQYALLHQINECEIVGKILLAAGQKIPHSFRRNLCLYLFPFSQLLWCGYTNGSTVPDNAIG